MRVALLSSRSSGTPWASLTAANHAEWCERHGATFVARHLPYEQAVADFSFIAALVGHFDALWCLDSDAVITNMHTRLEDIPLAPGMNVCEEGLGLPPPINCGSVVWVGPTALDMLRVLGAAEPEWRRLTWIWQQWIGDNLGSLAGLVTVHPSDAFNGCHHGETSCWRPGGFVYHPCGMPHPQRVAAIREKLEEVVR